MRSATIRGIFKDVCVTPNKPRTAVDVDMDEIGPSQLMEALIRIAIDLYGRVR